jgi:hypothetical protein
MTDSKALSGATASLAQKSEITVNRDTLFRWFSTTMAVADRLGATKNACELAVVASQIAGALRECDERLLSEINRNIALVNVRMKQLRMRRLGVFIEMPLMGELYLDLEKLLMEREELQLRQRGSDPEKLARAKLREFDRREGRNEVVIEINGQRYRAAVKPETIDALAKKMAREAGFTF